jgi:endonuclease-8
MPEGDTILRTARTLARALAGKTVARVSSPLTEIAGAGLAGRQVEAVEAHGKHLLIRFDDGRALHTHMQMNGAWHLYRAGERWREPEPTARVAIEVEARAGDPPLVAVCFKAPTVRLLRDADRDEAIGRLGPDLLASTFDAREAITRLRALGAMQVGEAIVTQSAVAGIGNIYKSEVLFARRIDPFRAVASLDDDALLALLAEARRMMRRNVAAGSAPRRTIARGHHASPFAVYDRTGEPCFICGAPIRRTRQGALKRSTYYCPTCQDARD